MAINELLIDAALRLLSKAEGEMQRTNLNKALFYLDLFWLRDHGVTLTGAKYVALRNGPVVDDYRDSLIKPLLASGLVGEHAIVLAPTVVAKPLRLIEGAVELPEIEPERDRVFEIVAQFASTRTAVAISEVAHKNLGWVAAEKEGEGTEINMLLALDQVMDDDPWLDEEPSPDEYDRLNQRLAGDFVAL